MSDSGGDSDRRREALEEGLEKAKEGAQKAAAGAKRLGRWLGQRLGQAAEQIADTEPVRQKLEQFEQFRAGRERDKRADALVSIYDHWAARLQQAIEDLDDDRERIAKSVESINYNINELRLRGVAESNDEMREYQGQVAALRAESRELEDARAPFQDEIDRLLRQCRAALARLDADPAQLEALQDEAREQVAASQARVESLPDELAGEGAQP